MKESLGFQLHAMQLFNPILGHAFPLFKVIKQKKDKKHYVYIPALFQALIVAVSRGNCFWPPG
jgi:hypothetical protein